jgi:predicted aldo/keto reductase-like oxidoreductase
MEQTRLGRTELMVSRSGFGALPIQRVGLEEAKTLLRRAFEGGMNFFDTSAMYTDSETKLGEALSEVRHEIIIATKTRCSDRETFFQELENSLKALKTDYIDIYQFHNLPTYCDPDDPEGLYQCMVEAKKKGMIRFIGITNHSLDIVMQAVASEKYDTVQYPLSSLSSDKELKLIEEAGKRDLGIIAMKALCGGLITNAASTFAFLRQFDNLVPIWGIQREWELDEFIALESNPPALDSEMWAIIEKDRLELAGDFCRSCGYCMPCPVGIPIMHAARMSFLCGRAPYQDLLSKRVKFGMGLINDCTECGECKEKCPYGLDIPEVLKVQLKAYEEFYDAHAGE